MSLYKYFSTSLLSPPQDKFREVELISNEHFYGPWYIQSNCFPEMVFQSLCPSGVHDNPHLPLLHSAMLCQPALIKHCFSWSNRVLFFSCFSSLLPFGFRSYWFLSFTCHLPNFNIVVLPVDFAKKFRVIQTLHSHPE